MAAVVSPVATRARFTASEAVQERVSSARRNRRKIGARARRRKQYRIKKLDRNLENARIGGLLALRASKAGRRAIKNPS